ncbi:unnamed protein product [Ectocarpus sp. CCAP 1310/34]|nr:unnamed protein product [Ectocarpus sp. CCAP 1310/34]
MRRTWPGARCPVTIDNVFSAPTPTQVKVFYESSSSKGKPFDHLPKGEELAWTESFHDKTLMGFIVYAQLLPKLLQNRIKLNAATYHWAHLDNSKEKGSTKLEQRRRAVDRLKRNGSTRSVFMRLPYRVDTSANILAFMKLDVEEEDERFRFFTKREFSMIFSKRGQVSSSSVYASCSMALSLLWFATAALARPCCLESIILPLSVTERRAMEQRFKCPPQFFDGPIQSFQTNWKDVFAAIDTHHRNINYTMLEKACEHKDKSVEAIGKIDGGVLGSIVSAHGQRACLKVQAECSRLEGGSSLFDDSVSNKLNEILAHFDCELWKARKKDKVERVVAAKMDPAGMNKKIEGGKILDPTDPKSIDRMHTMLTVISRQVWKPLKKLIGKALGASLEYPAAFLRISQQEGEHQYKHMITAGVLRESTIDDFVLALDATHYKFSLKGRRFKTASSGGASSAPPVSHFMLSPDQSMITRLIATVGHMYCGIQQCLDNEARRLFVNSEGQSCTQKDISSRFKRIGMHWLGISNLDPIGSNLDFSSFLQVSSTTLRNSYMAAAANTAAHTVGNELLGAVVNSACTGETTEKGARPYGKKLSARRLEFAGDIRASLAKFSGNGRLLFRAFLQKRNASQLVEGEKWFRRENTFFSQSDERLFQRFVDKANA